MPYSFICVEISYNQRTKSAFSPCIPLHRYSSAAVLVDFTATNFSETDIAPLKETAQTRDQGIKFLAKIRDQFWHVFSVFSVHEYVLKCEALFLHSLHRQLRAVPGNLVNCRPRRSFKKRRLTPYTWGLAQFEGGNTKHRKMVYRFI